jgi:hypothetical protein
VKTRLSPALVALFATGLPAGCVSHPAEQSGTNPANPGVAVGQAVGSAVGAVVGTVAGAVAAGAEGAADSATAPFTNERRIVRRWRTETTADGRTIQVPYEVEVDEQGREIPPK